jgi:excinuclease ABC subunit C
MLDKKSPTLKVLQNARNEAHRFGISFHRDTRSKNFSTSELSTIQGIGKTTSEKLLKHFGSIAQICKASSDEIVAVVGKKAAQRVIDFYDNKERNPPAE